MTVPRRNKGRTGEMRLHCWGECTIITELVYCVNRINEVKWTEWKTHVSFINEDPGPAGTAEFYHTLFVKQFLFLRNALI